MQHGTLVLIKQKQTVLRYYSLVNCIHAMKFTVNPSIKFVATTENVVFSVVATNLMLGLSNGLIL